MALLGVRVGTPQWFRALRVFASLALLGVSGCRDEGDGNASTDTGQDSAEASSSTGGDVPTTGSASSATADPPTTSTSTSSEPSSSTTENTGGSTGATTDPSGTATEGTTGGEMLCGLTDEGTEPWFEVRAGGQPLEPGGTLSLLCGGQGTFMFEMHVDVGGFEPAGEFVPFTVTMDVEGFNVGPEGHFYHLDPYSMFIGCEDFPGVSQQNFIRMFPPDEIPDYTALDGAAATLWLTMHAGGQSVPLELPLTISAVNENDEWCLCQFDPECA